MSDALSLWRRRPLIVRSRTGQHLSILDNAASQPRDDNAYEARPLKFWIPPLDLMYSSPLSTLPGELLNAILSYIEDSDRVCLQQTSRHLYNSILADANDLDGTQRARLARTIKRQRYGLACEAEAADVSLGGFDLDRQRGCWVCADVHSVTWFTDKQLAMPPIRRECVFSQRRIVLCKHKSITLVDIKNLQERGDQRNSMDITCKHCSDVSDSGREEHKILDSMVLRSQPLQMQRTNPDQHKFDPEHRNIPRYPASRTSELVIRNRPGPRPQSAAVAITRIRFDASVLRDVQTSNYVSSDLESRFELLVNLLRARFAAMGVWMCPHMTTADARVGEWFAGDLLAAVREQRLGRADRIPVIEKCGFGGCQMGVWFCRDELGDLGGGRFGVWKMHVRHCELVLPVVGSDRRWLACSVG
ncbi:hypothetical protein LTR56_011024 [Elasticomyces elasticus]|nr:hypothetical protein LTR56_011024 [Elasticomyces elasticus]KAK3654992.1 hypothetical protein LTR22_010459 [Elasticomyces elasticus]KAK4914037.1 hypothetical protein LTR49_017653 [Elasticomyces elasticus]KAK5757481.1 hypothetical protein LTS12_012439 [Elasticomyces elasticus]